MKIVLLRGRAGVLLLLLFVSLPVWAVQQGGKGSPEPKERPFTLIFEGDTVRAEIKQARLEDLLMEIARQMDLSIEVEGSIADEKVSAIFDSLPVEEGLHAILRNKNYILMYSEVAPAASLDPQFKVEGIKIVGKGYGPPPPIFRTGPVNATNSAGVNYNAGGQQQNIAAPVAPNKSVNERMDDLEALADSKGMAAIPFLSQMAHSDPDPDVREHAQELIQSIQEDAEGDADNTP